MAGNDLQHELQNKLKRLAGGDRSWLVDAVLALDKRPQSIRDLILAEPEDEEARMLVEEVLRREGAAGRG